MSANSLTSSIIIYIIYIVVNGNIATKPPPPSDYKCTKVGWFLDPLADNVFYRCVSLNEGVVRWKYMCNPGRHAGLDGLMITCLDKIPNKIKKPNPPSAPRPVASSFSCKNGAGWFINPTADHTAHKCVKRKGGGGFDIYSITCSGPFYYSIAKKSCLEKAPPAPATASLSSPAALPTWDHTCTKKLPYEKDLYWDAYYYKCDYKRGVLGNGPYKCEEGYFNERLKRCAPWTKISKGWTKVPPPCPPSDAELEDGKKCLESRRILKKNEELGVQGRRMRQPPTPKPTFHCLEPGHQVDPIKCYVYYNCVQRNDSIGFIKIEHHCPDRHMYVPVLHICRPSRYCVIPGKRNSTMGAGFPKNGVSTTLKPKMKKITPTTLPGNKTNKKGVTPTTLPGNKTNKKGVTPTTLPGNISKSKGVNNTLKPNPKKNGINLTSTTLKPMNDGNLKKPKLKRVTSTSTQAPIQS